MIDRLNRMMEAIAGRQSVCWLSVAMACGIVTYFALPFEPEIWPTVVLLLAAVAAAGRWHRHPAALRGGLISLLFTTGFLAAQLETARHDTRFIAQEIGPVSMTGRVSATEPLRAGVRLTLVGVDVRRLEPFEEPSRVRISTRRRDAEAIRAGDWITATVLLSPPSPPAVPGGFDFRRHAFFEGYGATGFSYGSPEIVKPRDVSALTGFTTWSIKLDDLRMALAHDVMQALSGQTGAVAAALLTGHRRAIPAETNDIMRDSGLAHLLAISGLHIGLVAGFVFFAIRAIGALLPAVALYHPIKKWAAGAALITAMLYMLLAGASVPTQRAFIMTAFVMIAIMIDRRAITLRLVAWAAIAVLAIAPHSLVEPGFQMSFAAVAALVASYEKLTPWFIRTFPPNASLLRRGVGYVAGVGASTLIAGTATAPFALYHFGQSALYGLPANLIAVPATGLWIMPAGLIGTLMAPFGLEGWAFAAMGQGIDFVLVIAEQVSALPGAITYIGTMPPVFLALVAAGGLLLILPSGKARTIGLVPLASALIVAAITKPPEIIVSQQGDLIALTAEGRTTMIEPARPVSRFNRELLTRATARQPTGLLDGAPYRCDSLGCRWQRQERSIAILWDEGALLEDCWASDLVITTFPLRGRCQQASQTIDLFDLWREGSLSVMLDGAIHIRHAESGQGNRPWHRFHRRTVRSPDTSTGE